MAVGNIIYSTSSTTIVAGDLINASDFERSTNLQVDTATGNLNIAGGIITGGVSNFGPVENLKIQGGSSGNAIAASPIYLTTGTYTNFTRRYDSPVIITGTITVVGDFRIRSSSYIDCKDATITSSGSGEIMLVANGYNSKYPGFTLGSTPLRNAGAMAINCGIISIPNGTVKLLAISSAGRSAGATSVYMLNGTQGVNPYISCSNLYFYSQGIYIDRNDTITYNINNVPNCTLTSTGNIYINTPNGATFEGRSNLGDIIYRAVSTGYSFEQIQATRGNNDFSRVVISRDDLEAFQNISWGTTVTGTSSIEWKNLKSNIGTLATTIPPGVKRITLTASGLTINPASEANTAYLRLGTSSGFETTGYLTVLATFTNSSNSATTFNSSLGMPVAGRSTSSLLIELYLVTPNVWVIVAECADTGTSYLTKSIAHKSLGGELTSITLALPSGTGNFFTAGTVKIVYK